MGRNASPFKIAHLYLKLNWDGLKYWNQVRKAAAKGHALLDRIDVLERGARVLKKAVDELSSAEASMPSFPQSPTTSPATSWSPTLSWSTSRDTSMRPW